MMSFKTALLLMCCTQSSVWSSPNPQGPQGSTAQISLNASPQSPANGLLINANVPRPVASGIGGSGASSATAGSGMGSGGTVGVGSKGMGPGGVNINMGMRPQMGMQNQGNFPIPFHNNILSSGFGLGSSAVHATTHSASEIMDGLSYGIGRVPAYVGYGVQSAGRLGKGGEQLFKAAVDLGTNGLYNGMQGLTLGMNMMNGLGNAGMKGLGKVAEGSSQILQHILSLGFTESGLFNTLIALGRLMSPGQGSFLSSGLNLTSLVNAAHYLGIPNTNVNLNTILDAAGRLKASMGNSSISSVASNVNLNGIRQAANSAVENLGLSQAWNILSSRLSGSATPSLQAAVNSNTQLPISVNLTVPGVNGAGLTGGNAGLQVSVPNSGGSWANWLG